MPDYFYSLEARKYRGKLGELKGEAVQAFEQFNKKVFAEGALTLKQKELIALAAAHVTRCPYCIDSHAKKAKDAGATDEEIAEAILVAVAMSAGASMAHANIAMQSLAEKQ
ncbi:MAG: carboxymuconolactone decarboxylase family protein [Dehalococcoidia bacterium]|nr:carboxymuconolactone decarboxylase family protein [Dehalococcoidia bacterium]